MIHQGSPDPHQHIAGSEQGQVRLRLLPPVGDRSQELRIHPRQPRQVLGIGLVRLALVLVDQTELPGVGDNHLVPAVGHEAADPGRVGPDFKSDSSPVHRREMPT